MLLLLWHCIPVAGFLYKFLGKACRVAWTYYRADELAVFGLLYSHIVVLDDDKACEVVP